ncbi:THAP domain-containing 2-like [Paramuricea clavata]|uniref:THAP domain-containing 2-like n=1 Tax=Paramuricea clavata TaxID=317549 RepID=A0A7D9HKL9_PARCT|nr:THAP domain-containing 2-like [Paramuricea clavata]
MASTLTYSSNKPNKPRGGQYCIAGWQNGKSCTNSQPTEGVSMHRFPKDKERLNKWTTFVRRHRAKFVPQQFSILCSMHFDEAAFTVNTGIAQSLNMRRKLQNDAVPTKDCMESTLQETQAVSDRDRRMILCEVPWNEGEVVSETEDIHPSVEVESSVNFCEEPSGSGTIIEDDHGKAKICANCDDLARKVTRLQKKVSWLRKSKQKLHERKVIPCVMLKVTILVKASIDPDVELDMAEIQDFVGNDEDGDMDWQPEEEMSQPEEENVMEHESRNTVR